MRAGGRLWECSHVHVWMIWERKCFQNKGLQAVNFGVNFGELVKEGVRMFTRVKSLLYKDLQTGRERVNVVNVI